MSPENDQGRGNSDPGDYGRTPKQPAGPASGPRPQQRFERERMSNDYDDEPTPRRRPAAPATAAGAGRLTSLLGNDPATRKLVGGAVGIGVVLMLAVGGWSLMGSHHGGIPIIGPPPGPVKDRPADPGGMQIMSSDDGATDMTGNGEAHLAPGPEQPDTKALARQYGVPPGTPAQDPAKTDATPAATAPSAAPPATAGSTSSATAPVNSPDATASATPEQPQPATPPATTPEKPQAQPSAPTNTAANTPAEAPKVAPKKEETPVHHAARPVEKPLPAPVPEPESVAPPKTAASEKTASKADVPSGSHEVQLGALDSEAAARKEWDSLRHQAPALFAGHTPLFEKTTRGDHTFVRLRIGGFADLKAARAYCVKLHAQSVACTPAQF
ncbi:SPOR domain-containing protein [Gluconobacter sp. OJB]|uniref:SPOR domain-containing protein n=1 Tax=Gluconobacter sp. OJB TaxID=3145196 RepID=UPI0031F92399